MLYAKYNIQSERTFEKPYIYDFFLRLRGRCANSRKQAGATTNKISSVNRSLMFLATSLGCILACSKRSDSGERCGVEKAMKSRGGLGREVPSLTSPPPSLLLFRAPFYFAPLPTI